MNLVPALFAEFAKSSTANELIIYRGLQHVDRYLASLYLKIRAAQEREEDEAEAAAQREREYESREAAEVAECERTPQEAGAAAEEGRSAAETSGKIGAACRQPTRPWTTEEQSLLEAALVELRASPISRNDGPS